MFGGLGSAVYQLDTVTEQVEFRGFIGGPINALVVQGETLYNGSHHGIIYSYDLPTNQQFDAISVSGDANAMASLDGELVVADSSGEISFVDPANGIVSNTIHSAVTDITAIGIDAGGLFVGGFSSLAERTHIGQDNFEVFAVCGSMINSMAFGPDTLFIGGIAFGGAAEGTVYLFDKFEGGVDYLGTFDVDSDATSMVFADGMLYIGGSSGIIYEMDPTNGVINRTFDTGADIQAMALESGIESCPADYDASGDLNFLDVSTFIELFNQQITPADTNGDGEFNFFDISEFLRIYSGGC